MNRAWSIAFSVLIALAALLGGGIALGAAGPGIELREHDQLRTGGDSAAAAPAAHGAGQSFRAEHDGLSSVAVQLQAVGPLPIGGTFRLWAGDDPSAPPLLTLPLDQADFAGNPYLAMHFPPQAGSAGRRYRFEIATPDPLADHVSFALAPLDSLSDGAASLDGADQPGDLTFRTFYTYSAVMFFGDLARALTGQAGLILAGAAFLLLPGLALGRVFPAWPPAVRLLAAPGLTLLAWPVVVYVARGPWATSGAGGSGVGGRGSDGAWMLGALAWAIIALSTAFLLWPTLARWRGRGTPRNYTFSTSVPDSGTSPADPPSDPPHTSHFTFYVLRFTPYGCTLAALVVGTFIARLATVRDLQAGMGLDAYHHTLVTQLLLDRGGVPGDYAPYAPLISFTYHFGFHTLAATLGALAPDAPPARLLTLLAGQLATTLPVLTLALFGARVLGNRWVGLVAGGLAGTVAIFPAFYVNWSRYTQGLGLALLPVAWVVFYDGLRIVGCGLRSGDGVAGGWRAWAGRWGPVTLVAVSAAGLFLTHYRIAGMYASYAALLFVGLLWRAWRNQPSPAQAAESGEMSDALIQNSEFRIQQLLYTAFVAVAGAAALLLPWLINLRRNFVTRFAGSADASNAAYYDWRFMLGTGQLAYWSSGVLLALAALGLLRGVWRRDWPPVALAVWWGGHLLWSNPTALRLPGAGYIDTVTVVTSGFVPICLLAAYPLVGAGRRLLDLRRLPGGYQFSPAWRPAVTGALVGCGLLVAAVGAVRLLPILDVRPYVSTADLAAMAWLREHAPPSALVVGNGFGQEWGPEAVQGSDAGVWIPVLAGRRSALPPIPAYNERPAQANYIPHAIALVRDTQSILAADPATAAAGWANLRAAGVTHLYIGSRGGVLDPALLLAQPAQTHLAFHQDDVWIFALTPAP